MDWRFNTIWLEQLPPRSVATVDFGNKTESPSDLSGAGYLWASRFKSQSASLDDFPAAKGVEYLHLTRANLQSFAGLSRFPQIKRLEAHDCRKLACDGGLSDVRNSLQWLHIHQAKKFVPGNELLSLVNLRVLCLNSCGPLPNLDFLQQFPQLVDFRFVDTNVLSGDLTPIVEHPTLCSVGFLNKRHYNLSEQEIDEHLRPRQRGATQKATKGKYETFRYVALSSPGKRSGATDQR